MNAIHDAISAICDDIRGDSAADANKTRAEAIFILSMAGLLAPKDAAEEDADDKGTA